MSGIIEAFGNLGPVQAISLVILASVAMAVVAFVLVAIIALFRD